MSNPVLPDIRKIAVLRPSALGDFIFALPALDALQAAYPGAELVYLGREWHSGFVPGRLAGAHRVVVVPHARSIEQIVQGVIIDPEQEEDFFRAMRAEQFDLALQMHGSGRTSNAFVQGLGARFTAGLRGSGADALERWIPYQYYQNETARLLEVAGLVGARPPESGFVPRLRVLESDLESASEAMRDLSRPYAVLHPGSTDPRRCWAPEKFAAVGDYCAAQGFAVALVGTAMDAERARAVAEIMRAPVTNLCERLSLGGLVGLLSQAGLFIGNDSGPMQMAYALGVRTLGLFWVEYVINSLPLSRARFSTCIAWGRTCPRCGAYCEKAEIDSPSGACRHEVSFVDEISPEAVMQGVQALLEAQ